MNRKFLSIALASCLVFPLAQNMQLAAQEPSNPPSEMKAEETREDSLDGSGRKNEEGLPEKGENQENSEGDSLKTEAAETQAADGGIALAGEDPEPDGHTFTITSTPGGTVNPSGEVFVPEGYGIGIVFKADEGYCLADYYVNGKLNQHSLPYANPYSLSYHFVDQDYTIHAVFKKKEPAEYFIDASCTEGGKITPAGHISVMECEDMTFEFAPDPGYLIKDVKVDGESKGSDLNQYTFSYVEGNHSIEVEFVKAEFTISASCSEGGTITPAGDVTVKNGDTQSFKFVPSQGFMLKDVKVDGESKGADFSEYKFENVDADHTIEVEFARCEFTITASSSEGGKITPEGAVGVEYKGERTFTITPDKSYAVKDVKVDGESKGADFTEYKFENVVADHTIEVEFEKTEFTIKVSSTAGGTVTPDKDVTVKKDGDQTFEIKPDSGYEISDVKVDGVSQGKKTSYKFEKVNADHTFSVEFAKTGTATSTANKTNSTTTKANTSVETDSVLWSSLAAAAAAGLIVIAVRARKQEF
ncbi:MAG: hypothetical protein HUJ54_10150 [Erysipelotrichaceae bacterium]|nr:hypothetical protein [Erysipelotrichaceae bacterium]